jgi:glycosyltransferase involved in cell wall biosynthesis
MKMIRVLQVCNQLGLGGTEKTLQIFCKYLDRSRFEVFACGRLAGGVRVKELQNLGIQVVQGPVDLIGLCRDMQIDICHVHRGGDYEPGSLPNKQNGLPRLVETNIFNAFDRKQSDAIDCHVFVSEFSRNRYFRQYGSHPQGHYEVIYNPVDFEEFPLSQKKFTCTVGQCARPDEQKWHPVVIDSLPRIFRKVSGARANFKGLPERLEDRLSHLRMDGRVQLFPPSLDMSDFYQRLDVFTHASRVGESFGCAIAEAMANRVPVVTLQTPQRKKSNAQAELVENKVTGFVCRWQWQYAGAVIELLQNHELREKFAKAGYEKAREQFDAARVTRKLENLYVELMDRPG